MSSDCLERVVDSKLLESCENIHKVDFSIEVSLSYKLHISSLYNNMSKHFTNYQIKQGIWFCKVTVLFMFNSTMFFVYCMIHIDTFIV